MFRPVPTISELARAFSMQNVQIKSVPNPYESKIDQTLTLDKELYKSSLGNPVYTNIVFLAGNYTDNKGRIINFGKLTYEAVLITVTQAKVIVKTQVQGNDGTVKEYIGLDDYQVTINGIICGANGHYPIDEVRNLKNMLDAPVPIEVASTYLQNLDIHELVISDYTLEQDEGGYSYQKFSINAISDIPQILRISNV